MLGNALENEQLLFNFTSEKPIKKKSKTIKESSTTEGNKEIAAREKKEKEFSNVKSQKESYSLERSPGKKFQKSRGLEKKSDVFYSSIFSKNPVTQPLAVKQQESISEPLFSDKSFNEINLHPHLVSCLKSRFEIEKVTTVQLKTIPVLLKGKDALVKSCTGSGKTLAYAVPMVQNLQEIRPKIQRADGVYALVVVPTRELALQCFESFSLLSKAFTWIVPGYLIGGEKKKSEKARLRKGINVLISTPGRLLDHLEFTACLSLEKITWLVIDEADKLLEECFEGDIAKIVSKCNSNRQSVLLSATLSKEVQSLAGISLSNPVHIDISTGIGNNTSDFHDLAIPQNLTQFIVVVPPKLRLSILSGFIVDNCLKGSFKAVIFMCSQNTVDFHFGLLSEVLGSCLKDKGHKCKFFKLHGNMKQEDRTEIFREFKSVKEGVLLSTDVAARGLDLPSVDWIVQYSCPYSTEIYVHRIGRTARIGQKGNSLLFLLPSENNFSNLLNEHRINFEEIPLHEYLKSLTLISDKLSFRGRGSAEDCASSLQAKYEEEVYNEEVLHQMAKDAFASYIQSYASYPKNVRYVLPFKALHLGHVAKSFCLRETPSQLGLSKFNNKQKHGNKPEKKKYPNQATSPKKRKYRGSVSEFGSGFSEFNQVTKAKKIKLQASISEYGNGLSDLEPNSNPKKKFLAKNSKFGHGLPSSKHNTGRKPKKHKQ